MKTQSLVLITLVFLLFSCNNENIKNDIFLDGINGDVSLIIETVYSVKEKFGEIQKENISRVYSYRYNNNGNLIELIEYNSDGKLNVKETIKYDEKMNKKSHLVSRPDFGGGGTQYVYSYKYDNRGNKIECEEQWNEGRSSERDTYQYDKNGRLIEEKQFNSSGVLENSYLYDKSGNKIEKYWYDKNNKNNSVGKHKWVYKYNVSGDVLEEVRYKLDGSLSQKRTYKYDTRRNKVEEEYYIYSKKYKQTLTYQYKFDKNGNWIYRTEFYDDNPTQITERKITYFSDN